MNDPTDPTGVGAVRHDYQGSRSINLIGGLVGVSAPPSGNDPFLDVQVSNVSLIYDIVVTT